MQKSEILETLTTLSDFGLFASSSWEKVADSFPSDTEQNRIKRDAIYSFVMAMQDASYQASSLRDLLSS